MHQQPFKRLMNLVVSGLKACAVSLDDNVIHSSTWEKHLLCIEKLLSHLSEAHLMINLAKCEFAKATVIYHWQSSVAGERATSRGKGVSN